MYNKCYCCPAQPPRCMSERERMLHEIQAHDFSLVDLTLYLDTHPTCYNALNCYQMHKMQREELVAAFTAKYGPLTSSQVTDSWTWACNPWPWELEG